MELSEFRNTSMLAASLQICIETEYDGDVELAAGQVVVSGPRPHLEMCVCVCVCVRNKEHTNLGR